MTAADTLLLVKTGFPGWYAQFQVAHDMDQIQARMKGISAVAKKATSDQIESLVRIAFASKRSASPAALVKIREAFTTVDPTFPQGGNDLELQVLAATCLVQIMESGTAPSRAALAISAAAFGGARGVRLPMDVVARAEVTLRDRAEINRQRPTIPGTFVPIGDLDFGSVKQKIQSQLDWNGVIAAFDESQRVIQEGLNQHTKQATAMFEKVAKHLVVKDEELDMLWWLTGQRSIDFDCSFGEVHTDAQSLVMPKEMADLTTVLPGPASVKGLLSRAGLEQRQKTKIPKVIKAVSAAWAQKFLGENEYSPVTMPLHFGLQRCVENGGGDEWIGNWSSVTEIPVDFEMTPLELGTLFYRERLMARFP